MASGSAAFGTPRRHFRVTDSTNERARDLAAAGATSGTIVTAAEQTEGRGRRGRQWTAPAGKAVLCSAVLSPLDARHALLPLAAPLAVCEAAESLAPLQCRVKWPNDVWVGERKLAGILIEAQPPNWAVIGIGLNVTTAAEDFPEELRLTATSLVSEGAEDIDNEELLASVLESLDGWLAAKPVDVIAAWAHRDALLGDRISWNGGEGVAAGIDESGALLVDTDNGRVALDAGEVHLLR